MRQTACLLVKPITVNGFAAPFNCAPACQASDLMKSQLSWFGVDALYLVGPIRGSTVGFLLFQHFSGGYAIEYSSCFISVLNLDLYAYCFDALMGWKSFMQTEQLVYTD